MYCCISLSQTYELSIIIITILQMRKLSLRVSVILKVM